VNNPIMLAGTIGINASITLNRLMRFFNRPIEPATTFMGFTKDHLVKLLQVSFKGVGPEM